MKICLPEYYISRDSNQGGAVFERELLKHLSQQGVELSVISAFPWHDDSTNIKISTIPIRNRHIYHLSSTVSFAYEMASYWKRERFDLLRAFTQRAVLASCQIVRKLIHVPLVTHIHHIEKVEKFAGISAKKWLQGVAAITTVSRFSAKQITDVYDISPDIIYPIYNGVNADKYRPQHSHHFRDQHRLNGKVILGFLGHLIERKNVSFLLEIIHILKRDLDNVILLVCGDGPEKANLQNKANELGIADAVMFMGLVSEEDKIKVLNAMDIFLFPSKLEGFGFAAAEAMLCEKPVIVSNSGALPEIVPHRKAGLVLPIDKPESWCDAVRAIIENSNQRLKYGKEGRKHAIQNFTWEETARKTIEVYENVIKRDSSKT